MRLAHARLGLAILGAVVGAVAGTIVWEPFRVMGMGGATYSLLWEYAAGRAGGMIGENFASHHDWRIFCSSFTARTACPGSLRGYRIHAVKLDNRDAHLHQNCQSSCDVIPDHDLVASRLLAGGRDRSAKHESVAPGKIFDSLVLQVLLGPFLSTWYRSFLCLLKTFPSPEAGRSPENHVVESSRS